MARAVPIIGSLAAAAVSLIPGVGPFLAPVVLGATGLLSAALAPKQPRQTRTQTLRAPVTDRGYPFGELVIGGILTEYEVTAGNRFHHMIVTLGDAPAAPWDGIPIVWLDDTPVFESEIDADGFVTSGKFSGSVRIKKHLGGPAQTADADLIAEVSRLDSNFKGVGIAYLWLRIDWQGDDFPNGLPGVRAWARTNEPVDTRDATRRWTPNAALILHEYLTDTDLGLGFDAADINATAADAAANICDEIVAAKEQGHAVVSVDTANDELNLAVAGSGAPVRIETGDRVEIFTDGTAPGGLATSTAYYAIVERLVGTNFTEGQTTTIALDPLDYTGAAATAITAGDVDAKHGQASGNPEDPFWWGIHAGIKLATSYANALARTPITITSAGTGQHVIIKTGEPRYAASGVIEAGETPKATIDKILTSMGGKLVWAGGEFHILPAAWRTPITPTFQTSGQNNDLWGPLTQSTRHSHSERFNAVRGILQTQLTVGEPTDYPPIIDSTFVTNDGGVQKFADMDFPWTSRVPTAQRLAKIALARHRREKRVQLPVGPKGFRAIPGTVIQVSNTRRSWTDKTFEVESMEDFQLEAEGDAPPLQGVTLNVAELDSTAFDFTPATDETIKPPASPLQGGSPFIVLPPTGLALASGDAELFVKADGTIVSRILVTWTTPDGFAVNDEVQFKKSADSTWEKIGLVRAGDGQVHIWDAEDGVSYDVRVRTINSAGVASPWTTGMHTVLGKAAAPPDVTTFTVARLPDGTRRFDWTATEPADVSSGGGFQLRFVSGTGGTWATMAAMHTGLLKVSPFETNELGAGTYTFGLKMVDSSGNESTNAQIIEATLGDPRLRGVITSRDEFQEGWDGTIVSGFKTPEGTLEATGSGDWSSLPATWDALADTWQGIVTNNSPLEYTTPVIDVGADLDFSPIVSVDGSGTQTITMRTGTEADGAPVGVFGAIGPVSGKRYSEYKISMAGTTPTVTGMVTLIDGETQVEDYEDVDTSAASAGRFERIATGHFKLATRGATAAISIATIRAFQNAGSGWTWELISKATTITGDSEPAAEFKIYSSGTLTDATIDAEIKGPKK